MSKARGLRPGVVGKLESRMTADGEREQSGSVSESGSGSGAMESVIRRGLALA